MLCYVLYWMDSVLKLRVFCWFVTGFAYIECRSEKDLEAALAKNKNFIGELFALHTCIDIKEYWFGRNVSAAVTAFCWRLENRTAFWKQKVI